MAKTQGKQTKSIPLDSWFLLSNPVPGVTYQIQYTLYPYNSAFAYNSTGYTQSDVQSICWLGSLYLCAVRINYSKSFPYLVLNNADFSNSYEIDILGYEYTD